MKIIPSSPTIKTHRTQLARIPNGRYYWHLYDSQFNRLRVADVEFIKWILMIAFLSLFSCRMESSKSKRKLEVVTYKQFNEFVNKTGYVTDAEKFGWSIVQSDVFGYTKVYGANWRIPDGHARPKSEDLPVTQVSYNDAIAYCEWSGTELPSYDQYWELIEDDNRKVITENNSPISEVTYVNVLGNVWEITCTESGNKIRLAGGSLFCSSNTCEGTSKKRALFVDKETGNIHIGFAVIK